jgi:hypothetical protein
MDGIIKMKFTIGGLICIALLLLFSGMTVRGDTFYEMSNELVRAGWTPVLSSSNTVAEWDFDNTHQATNFLNTNLSDSYIAGDEPENDFLVYSTNTCVMARSNVVAIECDDLTITNSGEFWYHNKQIGSIAPVGQIFSISSELMTNWATVSHTEPVLSGKQLTDAVYYYGLYHQIGTIQSNVIAVIDWKGQSKTVVLESTNIGTIERDISDAPNLIGQ